ncbi:MAG: type II secretion system F family protein [Dongiaceae bacterium]
MAAANLKNFPSSSWQRFFAQLAPMLQSGIAAEKALSFIAQDSESSDVAGLAGKARDQMKRGSSFSQSLSAHVAVEPLTGALLQAGEAAGQLGVSVEALDKYFTARQAWRREVMASLTYPLILAAVGLLVLLGLAYGVIPVFEELFEGRAASLPLLSSAVFAFAKGLRWVAPFMAVAGLALGVWAFWGQGAARANSMKIFPYLRRWRRKAEIVQALRILALQLTYGVTLSNALNLLAKQSDPALWQDHWQNAEQQVRRGVTLAKALGNIPEFPPVALRYIAIGEETGKLAELASRAALEAQNQWLSRTKTLAALIGPAVLLGLGLIVAVTVAGMILAVYSITGAVR